jgi:CO dehydrogenase/acetyl-CoA synthase delta subunit
MKKDARLTIRIPKELRARIVEIHRVYGVALPKIANESLKAFCEYVENKKQTPTFPLLVGPHSPTPQKSGRALARCRRGIAARQ